MLAVRRYVGAVMRARTVKPSTRSRDLAPEKIEPAERVIGLKAVADPAEAYAFFIETYRDKPVEFVEDILGIKTIQVWQKAFLRAVARGERRISVRAGHGVGKSAACSWALIWFFVTRYPQKSVLTAPTAAQLFDALFSEVKKWVGALPPPVRDTMEVFSDRIVHKAAPESSFMSARTSSKEKPEAIAGIHEENVLIICDEASAIPEEVYEAAAGSMSGHNATTILISNPTRNSGLFFRTHHDLKAHWHTMHVSCVGNPLVTPDFINQIANTYGPDSNRYRVRVLGEFATAEDDVLIAAELVDAAMIRDVFHNVNEPLKYGLDVARFGDDRSALVKRQGNVVLEVKSWHGNDLMETVGRVVNEAKQDKPVEICVDSIGVGGGVADRLRELKYNVRDVNVAEASAMNPEAAKLRDELWLSLRDWFKTRAVKIPNNADLRQEICSPTYTYLSNGKTKVEGKPEMKKRGLRSPDLADALCLSFAGEAAAVGGRITRWIPGQPLRRNIRGIV